MATRQTVVTRPVRTPNKCETKKGSCFGFELERLTRNLRGQHQQQPQNNKYVYKKKGNNNTPNQFSWMHCPAPAPLFLCKLHHTWVCILNAEVQVLRTSYNYEQRIIISFYSDNFSLIIHQRRVENID